jgi:hypothetical protein
VLCDIKPSGGAIFQIQVVLSISITKSSIRAKWDWFTPGLLESWIAVHPLIYQKSNGEIYVGLQWGNACDIISCTGWRYPVWRHVGEMN